MAIKIAVIRRMIKAKKVMIIIDIYNLLYIYSIIIFIVLLYIIFIVLMINKEISNIIYPYSYLLAHTYFT